MHAAVDHGGEPVMNQLSAAKILVWFFLSLEEKEGFNKNMVNKEQDVTFI
jgi:hypothetical protein